MVPGNQAPLRRRSHFVSRWVMVTRKVCTLDLNSITLSRVTGEGSDSAEWRRKIIIWRELNVKQNSSFFLGTKIDLREDRETLSILADAGQSPIKREQGQKLANKIRSVKYLECSALTQRGLKQASRSVGHLDIFGARQESMLKIFLNAVGQLLNTRKTRSARMENNTS